MTSQLENKEDTLDLAQICLEYFRSLQEIQIGRRRNDSNHVRSGVARARKAQDDLENLIEELAEEAEIKEEGQ